jgi:hypothetical protein
MDAPAIHPADQTDYPLTQPGSPAWHQVVSRARRELATTGCSVLPGFVPASALAALSEQSAALAPLAYFDVETVNAYNTAQDPGWPDDHPGRITMERGNAFVARDRIPGDAVIHRLYTSESFQRFVADCFELPALHELADPLSGLVLNVIRPGHEHPWHFDTNEFTVSMVTQQAQAGGVFEYCPNIRSAGAENFADVRDVLTGHGGRLIRRLPLRPGDLQLFRGRYALHRVSRVQGETARHSAIFAYSERPGVVGTAARTRQLFGRVLPEHLAAQASGARADQLLD